ncbi:MAG: peptidylprolyl isomerase [Bryobacterales bacterium]|nr:peptidylprolyl isomerase [Bryobacterales bacterium]
MKSFISLALCAAIPLCAQLSIQPGVPQVGAPGAPAAAAAPPPADKVLGTMDGDRLTAGDLRAMLIGAPPPALNSAKSDPADFLRWTALTKRFTALAEKQGFDKKSPYSDRIAWATGQVLAMARIQAEQQKGPMTEEGAKAYYETNPHLYGRAGVRLIYIAATKGKEAEAHAKLAEVQKQLKAGADFANVARQYSDDEDSAAKDGDFGVIETDSKIPVEMRKAVLKLDLNKVSEPFQQPAGWYIFQLTSKEVRPFEQVKAEIIQNASQEGVNGWMQREREAIALKIIDAGFFQKMKAAMMQSGATTPEDVKPEQVLAEVNGKPLTAEDYSGLLRAMPGQNRQNAITQPEEFLKQWAFMQRLSKQALQMGLDQKQPYKGQIWFNRGQILVQAYVDEYMNKIVIGPEDQKAGYDKDPERFKTATVQVIRIPFTVAPPPTTDPNAPKILNEEQGRKRAEAALAEIMGGLSFNQAVVKYAEDQELRDNGGFLPPFTKQDRQIPDQIKQMVFGAKQGDVLGPLKLPNGFYLFRVDKLAQKTYEQVKDQVYEEMRQAHFQKWFDGERNSAKVTVEDPEAFRAVADEFTARQ